MLWPCSSEPSGLGYEVPGKKYTNTKMNISSLKGIITGEEECSDYSVPQNVSFLIMFENLFWMYLKLEAPLTSSYWWSWEEGFHEMALGSKVTGVWLVETGSDKDRKASVFRMLQWAISTLLRWPFTVARHSVLFLEWVATLCNAEPHFYPPYISLGKELELPSVFFFFFILLNF